MIHLATSLEQAQEWEGEYRLGGTDVQARRRYRVSKGPIVDLSRIPKLDQIRWSKTKVTVGAGVKLAQIAADPKIRDHYPGFCLAAGSLATPQVRTMASLAGSLLQRTRCPYFRHPETSCYKKGGDQCPARQGEHRFGVCFDLGPCVHPHPSTLAMVLLAYEARVKIHGSRKSRPVEELYGDGSDPSRDHHLEKGEILTAVILDAFWPDEHAAYFRAISRARAEWPLVEAAVRFTLQDTVIEKAAVTLGGVAPIPLRMTQVEQALVGQPATPETFEAASKLAIEDASPLPQTNYKLTLIEATLRETMRRAKERIWQGEG